MIFVESKIEIDNLLAFLKPEKYHKLIEAIEIQVGRFEYQNNENENDNNENNDNEENKDDEEIKEDKSETKKEETKS